MLEINEHNKKSLDQWEWVINKNTRYLRSKILFRKGFSHGFFSSKSSKKNAENLLKNENPLLSFHSLNQIHSNNVVNASESSDTEIAKADGLINDKKNQSLWIKTADCIPVLLADYKTRKVAAVHSGWRGLANQILTKTIIKMESLGSLRSNIIACMGPSISGIKYEVDNDVAEKIYDSLDDFEANSILTTERKLKRLNEIGAIKSRLSGTKVLLDIRIAASIQLLNFGLRKNYLCISKTCTYLEEDLFNSWRRDKSKNAQWSFINS